MSAPSVFLSGTLAECPPVFNAAEWCLSAGVTSGREAFVAVDPDAGLVHSWNFSELRDRVLRAAAAYQASGVAPGDRVALLLGDVPQFPVAYFGAIAAGAVATPLSSQLSASEIARILAVVRPSAIVGGRAETLPAAALEFGSPMGFTQRGANDPALLVFTSGSSGRPKGVLHAQRAFWARQSMREGWHGIGRGDRVMHAGAFNWTFTLGVGLADTWRVGGTALLNAGRRDPEVWPELARAYQPTIFAGAPAVFRRVLKYGRGLGAAFSSLRHAVAAGEAVSPRISREWRDATGKPLLEALGMSEVSTFVSTPPERVSEPGVAGWPQPGRHVAVLGQDGAPVPRETVGMLAVHCDDPGLMLEYWREKAATRAAFLGEWFLTGDRVRMRADGAILYAGRADDQMNAQGFRVDPGEVEAAVMQVDGVAECAVRALDVGDDVEIIAAWVVAEDGNILSRDAIMASIASRLAKYKMPREIFQVLELPRSANGKILRRDLAVREDDRL